MEMLNSISMLMKSDLWTNIINLFAKWLVNYGWAIIVFTIVLKLVLSPLDIFQRFSSQKQTKVMAIMQPELDALKQKYGDDQARLNQETTKLYKKYNVSVGGMCLPLLLTMGLSLIIVFTLFASVREYGNVKLYSTYKQLDQVVEENLSNKSFDQLVDSEIADLQSKVKDKYSELQKQNGWLWVKNVWKSDTHTSQFVSFDSYADYMKLTEEQKQSAKERNEFIVNTVVGSDKDHNGQYILIVLAVLVSCLTQYISAKLLSPKGQKLSGMNLIMMIVIPVTMLILALSSNVIYTLYIIVNSVMTAIISSIISIIIKRKAQNGQDILLPKKKVEVVEYSRNYKK